MPLWVLFFIGLTILLPLPLMVSRTPSGMGDTYIATASYGGIFFNQFYALLCACCCFGYLHKTRSAYMLHGLPVTRNSLFLTNYTSGLLFALVPYLVILGISIAVAPGMDGALEAFGIMMLQFVFYYGLAVFCMMLSGTTAAGAVIYFLLNYLAALLGSLILAVVQPMICGLRYTGAGYLCFSPAVYYLYNELGDKMAQWGYLLAIAGAGVVLSVCAWLMYRRRRLETAGDVIAYEPAKPIAKYLFTLLISMTLGLLLHLIVFGNFSGGSGKNLAELIVCLLIGGLLGYFGAEMLLKKSLRVFRGKAFLGFAAYALVLSLCLVGVNCDLLGIEGYMPEAGEIQSVSIDMNTDLDIVLTQQEDFQQVLQIHEGLYQREKELRNADEWAQNTVNITYKLKSGKTVYRQYEMYGSWSYSTEPSDKALLTLFERKDLTLDYFERSGLFDAEYVYLPNGAVLSSTQISELADCIRADVEDGSLTVYKLMNSWDNGEPAWIEYESAKDKTGYRAYQYLELPRSAKRTVAYVEDHDADYVEDAEIYQ